MQFSRNTSTVNKNSILSALIKYIVILIIVGGAITMLGKIDFPSPNNEIEKIIPNAKLKIVK
tara:strand:- start:4 stop:189 length:186 start_codon:yes stop_codon:yes gene_type:complete